MKLFGMNFIALALAALVLISCAPTMYVQTTSDASASLSKSALHYIIPPANTDSQQNKNLYQMVVNAFQVNQIAVTKSKNEAAYLVTWGVQDQSKQVRRIQATPTNSWYGQNNVNGYGIYGEPIYGQAATGPNYVPVITSYQMQNFTISVWKNEATGKHTSTAVWSGSATAGTGDVKDPSKIIDEIVVRYGTNFQGNTEIRN